MQLFSIKRIALSMASVILTVLAMPTQVFAVQGGGVTPIGIPEGLAHIYSTTGPYTHDQDATVAPPGYTYHSGFLNDPLAAIFPTSSRIADSAEAFANDKGVFYANAYKRFGTNPDSPIRDGVRATAKWGQAFRKNTDDAWMTFKTTKAKLYVDGRSAYYGPGATGSYASLYSTGTVGSYSAGTQWEFSRTIIDLQYIERDGWLSWTDGLNCQLTLELVDVHELTCDPHTVSVDLSQIAVGDSFYIYMDAAAVARSSQVEGEHHVFAEFRDPLDTGGGLIIEVDGLTPLDNFSSAVAPADRAHAVAEQADHKIVVAGFAYDAASKDTVFALARYQPDGSLDPGFGSSGKLTVDFGNGASVAHAVAIQSDGKIVVAGSAGSGTNNDLALVRLNADGTLDGSFGSGGKVLFDVAAADDNAFAIAIQPDGKIVVAGSAWNGANNDFVVARFNTNGTPDTAGFGSGTGFVATDFAAADDIARAVRLQNDGKIVLAGSANMGASFADFAVVRYNADGSLDTSFDGDGRAHADFFAGGDLAQGMVLQADGAIVVAGSALVSGHNQLAAVRFKSDGSLDGSFGITGRVSHPVSGDQDYGHAIAIQNDGKLILAGHTRTGAGDDMVISRLNADGSIDSAWGTGGDTVVDFASSDDRAGVLAIQADGRVLVAGYATTATGEDFAVIRLQP